MDLDQLWPPYGFTVTSGELSLRMLRESDVPAMVDLALSGIHPADQMPFLTGWTDAPADELPGRYLQYATSLTANFSRSAPTLDCVVRLRGMPIGVQGFDAQSDFVISRTGATGSWLAQRYQGQGLGTRMRQMMCAFAFDVLGATEITSAAFIDNQASLAVSHKLGYQDNGVQRRVVRGAVQLDQALVLTESDFVRGEPITVTGGEALVAFLGL